MVIISLLLTLLFGYSLVWLINPDLRPFGRAALSFLLGLGLQTLGMFYLAILGIKLTHSNVSIMLLLIIILLFALGRFVFKKQIITSKKLDTNVINIKRIRKAELFMLAAFLGISLYVILAGLYWPVVGWDSIALYDFRAKVFYLTGYMEDAIRRGYFFGYPLMTSMAHTWIYLSGFMYPKFLYSLMYLSFGVLFFEISTKRVDRLSAGIFTLMALLAYPIFSHAAFDYTNLPYTIYFFLGSAFLFLYTKNKHVSWLLLAALMTGLSTWIRSTDPFWVVNLIVLTIFIAFNIRKFYHLIIYLIIFFAIQQSWSIYLTQMAPHVSAGSLAQSSTLILLKGIDVGRLFQVSLFIANEIGGIIIPYLLLFILTLILDIKDTKNNLYLYLIVAGNFALLFVGAYIFSFIWEGWSLIGESVGRIASVFVPLFIYASVININKLVFGKSES